MSEVMERTDDLVDRASIAAHQKKIATLRERAARAAEALRLEQSVHGTAEANYRAAVESGSADRYDLKSALDAAASRLVVESKSTMRRERRLRFISPRRRRLLRLRIRACTKPASGAGLLPRKRPTG